MNDIPHINISLFPASLSYSYRLFSVSISTPPPIYEVDNIRVQRGCNYSSAKNSQRSKKKQNSN